MDDPFAEFYLGLPQRPSSRATYNPFIRQSRQERREAKRLKRIQKKQEKRKRVIDISLKRVKKFQGRAKAKALTLPQQVFSRTIDQLIKDGNNKYVVSVGDRNYTLNQDNYNRLKTLFTRDGLIMLDRLGGGGSDVEITKELVRVKDFRVSKFVPRKPVPQGGFFPYTHNLVGLDLTDLQIFETDKIDYDLINKENCLLTALRVAGVDVAPIAQFIKTRDIPQKKLKQIAERFGLHIMIKKNGQSVKHYGDKALEPIKIGLVKDHYFLIKEVPITKWALNNYEAIKDKERWWEYRRKGERDTSRFIDSWTLVNNFEKYLTPMDRASIIQTTFDNLGGDMNIELFDDKNFKDNSLPEPKEDKVEWVNVFFDFETTTQGQHEPYLVCASGVGIYRGVDCGKKMLDSMVRLHSGKGLRMFAHNAGYDIRFIFKYLRDVSLIERGRSLLRGKAKYYDTPIIIQDTYAHIPMALAGFGKTFALDVKKELLPYSIYTKKNVEKRWVPLLECYKGVNFEYDKKLINKSNPVKETREEFREIFLNNCREWGVIDKKNRVDIVEYSARYCAMDVEVLDKGYTKFKGWMKEITNLNIDDFCSLPSVADRYMNPCYEGVYQVSGVVREFIQSAMVGGRTMCANNQKQIVDDLVADYDAVSLYPSAMKELGGYLKGKPKVWRGEDLSQMDGYFVEIEITKVGIERAFSLMSMRNEEGIRYFHNDMVGKRMIVDKTILEDLVEFQKVEFKVIRGYYYNEGRNNKLGEMISYLFNERVKAKKQGNPIQNVYKLLMNSAYGKTLLKPFDTETKYVWKDDIERFVDRNYNQIMEFYEMDNGMYSVKVKKTINEHFNNAPCGVEVLSTSKRIMNRVMCLAEDNGIPIFYQDTDSVHILNNTVKPLEDAFRSKYGKELNGKGMGQFHTDFDSALLDGDSIIARRSIFLGKKCYLDVLTDKNGGLDYHIRMKGCSTNSIYYYCAKNGITVEQLYERMYDGEVIELDQTCDGKCIKFEYTKGFNVETKTDFSRSVKF